MVRDMEKELDDAHHFLNKDITIKKKSDSFVRGICIRYDETGVTVILNHKHVFIPWINVEEIVFGGELQSRLNH
jgi:hypothetical protein